MNRGKYLLRQKFVIAIFFVSIIAVSIVVAQSIFNWRIQSPAGGISSTGNTIWYNVNASPASFPSLSWTTTGSLATCTIQVDYSTNASTVAGQAVPAQTCTATGNIIITTSATYQWIRVSYILGAGGGSLTFVAQGCKNSTCTTGGGGGGGSLPSATNQGQVLSSTGPGTTYVAQYKPFISAADYGCVGDDSTSNDTCWANLNTLAQASTIPLTIVFGMDRITGSTYKWSNSPSFTKPVTIECVPGVTFDYAGTGNEITFGDIGDATGVVFDFKPYRVLNCGHIGGASATYGIYGGLNHWKIEIADNWWYNWGSGLNWAIYCKGNNDCHVHHSKYWQDTGSATNWIQCPDAGTVGWGACVVSHNDLNCVAHASGVGAPTQGQCGIAMWIQTSTGTEISHNPFISAFTTGIRLETPAGGIGISVEDNYFEMNASGQAIQLGDPTKGSETITSVLITSNTFAGGAGSLPITVANGTTLLRDSQFIGNFIRAGGTISPLVNINNVGGQSGNCASGNITQGNGVRNPGFLLAEIWTTCPSGEKVQILSQATSGGNFSGFLAHTSTAGGAYGWTSDDGAADSKTWDFIQATAASDLCLRAVNDGNTAANNVFCAIRGTGAAVSTFQVTPTITSLVTTGTAPFVVSSTTPVTNLVTTPTTYSHTGIQQTNIHVVLDRCTLGTSCVVTLTGAAVFTSSTSYNCAGNDENGSQAVNFVPTSGSAFTLNGTGTDSIAYIRVGN